MDLHVVELRVTHAAAGVRATDETVTFREQGLYDLAGGGVTVAAPALPDSDVSDDPIATLGLFGGRIAEAVTEGIGVGRDTLVVGGNCTALPGVLGGLQQALGPAARIGLVWFDAHGDFNTPRTTPSGMLGGMPVAVSAGLCYPVWREGARQAVPLPTNRIVMVDVRNLDPEEERLIRATDMAVVPIAGAAFDTAIARLADAVDLIYLHVDLDVLDARLTPSHRTKEPNGPGIPETLDAIRAVLGTAKVRAVGFVSIYPEGPDGETSLASATTLLRETLTAWRGASEG